MEKKIITGMFLIPTSSNPSNAFNIANLLANQIGHFNCKVHTDAASIKYDGKLSNDHKETLDKLADNNDYAIIYIEAYEDDERLSCNTICLL